MFIIKNKFVFITISAILVTASLVTIAVFGLKLGIDFKGGALTIVFIASMFLSLALPAINGVYADFIQEKKKYGEEVETLTDLYTNLGYIVGPISAGFLADILGNAASISSVGIFGIVVAIILMLTTPRHIEIREKNIAG
jgi:MFS family permease